MPKCNSRWTDQEARDRSSEQKDDVFRKYVLPKLKFGQDFRAIIMPARYGIELVELEKLGVLPFQMFAIEREASTLAVMKSDARVTTLKRALPAQTAIDFIQAECPKFDYVYGDFFGQPDLTHKEFLHKLFALDGGMLKSGSFLQLTFGLNRCRELIKYFNRMLLAAGRAKHLPTRHYIDALIELTGHPRYKRLKDYNYRSKTGVRYLRYISTVVEFP